MFAFLPQFIDPAAGPVWLQLLVLGVSKSWQELFPWGQSQWHQGHLELAT